MPTVQFSDYAQIIATHDLETLMQTKLLRTGISHSLESFYVPFDAFNKSAKVVLVGITPGQVQWRNALISAQQSLAFNLTEAELLSRAKAMGAFSGPMRQHLVKMLDHVGLAEKLGIHSTASLFDQDAHLVQMSSVLKHCVLMDGKNYTGSSPNMLKNTFLRQHIEDYFVQEVQQLPHALYIPLGKSVIEVLHHLSSLGYLQPEQILDGFPHPSGANAERIQYFLGNKSADSLSTKTNPIKIDQAKVTLLEKLEKLTSLRHLNC